MNIFESSRTRGSLRARGAEFLRVPASCALAAQLSIAPSSLAANNKAVSLPAATATASDPVLKAMQTELARATTELGKTEQAPYFLSYTVYDQDFVVLVGAYGSLLTSAAVQRRQADGNMRVG